ncbi:hypothetical protein LSH36_31g08029 [Paralvinella palmiformis]|uniref:Uncharacterized protein n=1 Tax=Paralvinella palmiformis TaxID=53620 RepID=A0AAD9K9H5_9ANNE|nr:hypothetical protein LSH36_31g08029 [Paralvinella palmiformis]
MSYYTSLTHLKYDRAVKMIDAVSELFIITTAGHVLAKRKYKHDIKVNTTEMFMAKLQDSEQILPHFVSNHFKFNELDGVQFCQIRRQQIYFVAACKKGTSPIFVIEILTR